MTEKKIYDVEVTREGDLWLAAVVGLPGAHTFARSLSALHRAVAEVIVLMDDLPDGAVDSVEFVYEYKVGVNDAAIARAREARIRAERAERESASAIRTAVAGLPATMSVRDVAVLLGISHQRVKQVRDELRLAGGRLAAVGC
jgi:hypothetical protein